MPISLRAYLDKLDDLLNTSATDEVIHHCRHILKYFPRAVAVYRQLGQALLYSARWDEAATVLRRVLSVLPDDYVAHIGLSEVYVQRNRSNDAIWHLERAYEQNPNDTDIINSLRDLYKRYQNVDHARLQLTTAAVARQYIRSGLFTQAVETLRGTLERLPDRVDLRLLLAQTLWDMGSTLEAGETAMDVLQVLPDCLEANRIMTQLWLAEGRPSDAQRYLSRIEATDPYLALELATGSAPDDTFTLEELDYRRFARSSLATDQPAWLQEVTPGEPDFADLFQRDDAPAASPAQPTSGRWAGFDPGALSPEWGGEPDKAGEAVPDDLFDDLSNEWMLGGSAQPTPAASESDFDDDALLRDLLGEPDAVPASAMPDWLSAAAPKGQQPAQSPEDEALMWLQAAPASQSADDAEALPNSRIAEDPLAWLRGSGIEIDDQGQRPAPPTDNDDDTSIESADEDPLAWLAGSGVELQEQPEPAFDPFEGDDNTPISDPAADPYSWMAQYEDLTLLDDDDSPQPADDEVLNELLAEAVSPIPPENTPTEPDDAEDDLFQWLNTPAMLEDDSTIPLPEHELSSTEALDNQRLLALQQAEIENQQSAPADTDGDESMNDKDLPEWLGSSSDEPQPEQNADWLDSDSADMPDWLSSLEPQADTASTPVSSQQPDEDEDGFAWMASESPTDDEEDEMPDWLRSMQPEEPATGETMQFGSADDAAEDEEPIGFEWMSSSAEQPAAADDMPSWLRDMQPAETASSADDEDDSGFEWMALPEDEPAPAAAAPTPQWLTDDDDEQAQPAATADDDASWLAALQPSSATATADDDDEFEWMSSFDEPEPVGTAMLSTEDSDDESDAVPDWLNALQPAAEAEPAAAEVPDWLAGMQPVASTDDEPAQDEAESEFEWMSGFEESDEDLLPAATATETDIPDWLQEEDAEEAAPLPAPVMADAEDEDFEWMSGDEFGMDEEEEDAYAEEEPIRGMTGLLNELSQAKRASSEIPASAAAPEGDFEWMSEFEDESDTPADAEAEFAWLSDLSEDDEPAAEPVQPTATEDVPGWLQGLGYTEPEELQPFAEAATYDEPEPVDEEWTPQMEAVSDGVLVAAAEEDLLAQRSDWPEDEFDAILAEGAPAADTEHSPAQNAPDWLNAMVPGLDLNYEAEEEEPLEHQYSLDQSRREFGWLMDIVEEETGMVAAVEDEEAAPRVRRFIFSRPPAWLRGLRPNQKDEEWTKNDQPADENDLDLPDWLK
jgi:tetratricopeptide (TPR) repeat protein